MAGAMQLTLHPSGGSWRMIFFLPFHSLFSPPRDFPPICCIKCYNRRRFSSPVQLVTGQQSVCGNICVFPQTVCSLKHILLLLSFTWCLPRLFTASTCKSSDMLPFQVHSTESGCSGISIRMEVWFVVEWQFVALSGTRVFWVMVRSSRAQVVCVGCSCLWSLTTLNLFWINDGA